MWTSATKNTTGKFVWENQAEVRAFPSFVRDEVRDGRKLPTSFVRGSEKLIGSLLWNDGQPDMREGTDVIIANVQLPYGVFLQTTLYDHTITRYDALRVLCEHRC